MTKTNSWPIKALHLMMALLLATSFALVAAPPAEAAVTKVTITGPTTDAPAIVPAGGTVTVEADVTVDDAYRANYPVDVTIEIFDGAVIIGSWEGTVSSDRDGAHTFSITKPVTIAATGIDGWYDLAVGARHPAGAGGWTTDTEPNAVKADFTAPTLVSIEWNDKQAAGEEGYSFISAGDELVFTFSEAMDTTTLDEIKEVNTQLAPPGRTYGADLTLQWNLPGTVLTVTLGADPTILSGDTVNPSDKVKDKAGNPDGTVAPGPAIVDDVSPILNDITFEDRDASGDLSGGDRLVFHFSEAMNPATVTTANIDLRLPIIVGTGTTYGTVPAGLSLSWDGAGRVLTVVLGADNDLAFGDKVNPAPAVTDLAGNPDATVDAQEIEVHPVLLSIVWTDVDNNGTIDKNDTLKFTFSKAMDTTTLDTAAEINARLPVSDDRHYGDIGDDSDSWNPPYNTILTLTLGARPTIEVGDTVNPTDAVTDAEGNKDATVDPGPAIPGDPKLTKLLWNDADQDGNVEAGETLEFVFSEPMDTTTLDTAAEINDRLPVSYDRHYGAIVDTDISWDPTGTILTLTLGARPTIALGDTVNPTTHVKDADGHSDVTLLAGPAVDAYPWLERIEWVDTDGSRGINPRDKLKFHFSEPMYTETLNEPTEINERLPVSGARNYGDIGEDDILWDDAGIILTLRLGANATVADGDTVNPTDAVTDIEGNRDHTIAPGPSIEDDRGPVLTKIVWINVDESIDPDTGAQTVTGGDEVVFTFSEPMDTTTITAQNVNSVLMSDGGHPFDYGTIDAGMSVAWNPAGDTLTVTLGTNAGIAVDNRVNPADGVTDAAGNKDATVDAGPAVTDGPWLMSIVWTDVNANGFIDAGDTLKFHFSKAMDITTLDTADEINERLPVSDDRHFGAIDDGSDSWNGAGTILTLTLGADPTILQGDTVNPADAVVDDDGNADVTQGTGPAVKNAVVPKILEVTGTAVHAADDTIVITFNENVSGADLAASLVVETGPDADNLTTLALTDAMLDYADATTEQPATLTITLPEPALHLVNDHMVRVTPVADAITDVDGNAVDVGEVDHDPITPDDTDPTFTIEATTVEGANDTIVLTFSEYVRPSIGNWNLVTVGEDKTEFYSIKAGPAGALVDLDLTNATITPADDSATKTVTISLAELIGDLTTGEKAEVTLAADAVKDLAGLAVTELVGEVAITGDVKEPTFTIAYFTDEALTIPAPDYLKAGTYYIKITASEKLQAPPTISIEAEGAANDVTNEPTIHVSGNTIFRFQRLVRHDPAAVGEVIEVITLTGTDLAGNEAVNADVIGEKWTDTTAPTMVTLHSPDGGEVWLEGEARPITWTATDIHMPDIELTIMLEYFDGISWHTIIPDTENDSIYTWTVPAVDTADALVRVTATDRAGNAKSDISDTFFTIAPAPVDPVPVTTIELAKGWNLISLMLIPEDPAIEVVLEGILDDVISVWHYDAETMAWKLFRPGVGGALTEMVDGEGYWINMAAAATLTVVGTEMPLPPAPPPTYPLFEGWNHIGFTSTIPMTVEEYLGPAVMEIFESMWGYDAVTGRWVRVRPGVEGENILNPGMGYWLFVSADGEIPLGIPEEYLE
ncbi:hypothetical protein M1N92_05245 [Dehalococcoidia bacterium]|nr:hypothetical protein [Dehalococcoidia bacterium]